MNVSEWLGLNEYVNKKGKRIKHNELKKCPQ